jgi:autotransporter-associated beta strand protein
MAHRISCGAGRAVVRWALLSTTILGGLCLGVPVANAVDGMWLPAPATADWNTGTNWSSSPAVPDGTATFGASNTTSLTFSSATTSIGTIQFNAGAPAYSFAGGNTVNINATGIVNNSSFAPAFNGLNLNFNNGSTAANANITSSGLSFNNTSTAASATITNTDVQFFNTSSAGNATIAVGTFMNFNDSSTAGSATITNSGPGFTVVQFNNTSTAGRATITNDEQVSFEDTSTAGNATIINHNFAILAFFVSSTAGNATITNSSGFFIFQDSSTAGNATIINNSGGQTFFENNATAGNATINNSGIVDFSGTTGPNGDNKVTAGSIAGSGNYFLGGNQLTVGGNNLSTVVSGIISDGGTFGGTGASLVKVGTGTLTLSGANTYSGGTIVQGGLINFSSAGNFGSGTITLDGGGLQWASGTSTDISSKLAAFGSGGATLDTNGNNVALASPLSGSGGLTKVGAGTLTLSGTNGYSGATAVNAGTLVVNGSIVNSAVTVNSGATLAGIGTVGATTIASGGTFAPGNSPGTMTVQGNLAFQAGALYLVQVNPSIASSANVTAGGSATLAGSVQAVFASGSYMARTYTIISAAGGRSGTFGSLTTGNLPAGFTASLSYTATDAILNLTATLGQPTGPSAPGTASASSAQPNVANALNAFFNNGGTLPPAFVAIFGLTGGNLANALTLLSGEAATGAQQAAFRVSDQFLGLMLDPFVDGRSSVGGADRPALGFAAAGGALPEDVALAYASVLKAPKAAPPIYEPRWTSWAGGFGGGTRLSGDRAGLGSHDLSATTAGYAGGLDYHLSRDSVAGFALAGGGTSWGLAQGLGGGKSDAFQAGVYGATRSGPAYLAAAFDYTNHWMSTDRFAFAGDHLTASFGAQALGARAESGYRFASAAGGFTPYAAIQAQSFRTPSYAETDTNSGGFALTYNARTASDTRSELGERFDCLLLVNPASVLALRTRLAWAHDWVSGPTLAPVFQTLPGASFIVNGATPAKNSALTSAGAELRLANGITLLGKFDGEFAFHSSTYAGTGTVRYTW